MHTPAENFEMAARCGLDSQQAGCLCFDSLMPSFAGHGWSTGLFEFMSPEAKEITDWGYVCTSCVCPCVQFYYNWLHILNGAPVWRHLLCLYEPSHT
jgi:hypothetical protein